MDEPHGPCHLLQVYKRPHRTFLNKQKWVPAKINVNPLGMPHLWTASDPYTKIHADM